MPWQFSCRTAAPFLRTRRDLGFNESVWIVCSISSVKIQTHLFISSLIRWMTDMQSKLPVKTLMKRRPAAQARFERNTYRLHTQNPTAASACMTWQCQVTSPEHVWTNSLCVLILPPVLKDFRSSSMLRCVVVIPAEERYLSLLQNVQACSEPTQPPIERVPRRNVRRTLISV